MRPAAAVSEQKKARKDALFKKESKKFKKAVDKPAPA